MKNLLIKNDLETRKEIKKILSIRHAIDVWENIIYEECPMNGSVMNLSEIPRNIFNKIKIYTDSALSFPIESLNITWIKGDTPIHQNSLKGTGQIAEDRSFLIYMQYSEDKLIFGEESYFFIKDKPIKFNGDIDHATEDCVDDNLRLFIGPITTDADGLVAFFVALIL